MASPRTQNSLLGPGDRLRGHAQSPCEQEVCRLRPHPPAQDVSPLSRLVPMIATTSASMCPLDILSKPACKDGDSNGVR